MAYPTTFVDLQNTVINKLRLDATADLQRVKDTLNQVYAQVCIQTEANQTAGTAALTAGSATYTLPSDVLRIKEIVIQPVGQTANGGTLTETSLGDILNRRQTGSATGSTGSSATLYALAGLSQLELWPTPAAADTATFYYVALPTALANDADTLILQEPYPKVVEYGALAELSDFLVGADDPATQQYRQLYETWLQRFRVHLGRRAGGHTNQIPVVGGNGYRPAHDPSADVARAW